jgi:hypothetical protein
MLFFRLSICSRRVWETFAFSTYVAVLVEWKKRWANYTKKVLALPKVKWRPSFNWVATTHQSFQIRDRFNNTSMRWFSLTLRTILSYYPWAEPAFHISAGFAFIYQVATANPEFWSTVRLFLDLIIPPLLCWKHYRSTSIWRFSQSRKPTYQIQSIKKRAGDETHFSKRPLSIARNAVPTYIWFFAWRNLGRFSLWPRTHKIGLFPTAS